MAVMAWGFFASSCDAKKAPKMTSALDSVSYLIGVNVGESMKTFPGEKLNLDLLIKGLKQAIESDSSVLEMDPYQVQMFVQNYVMEAQQRDAEKTKEASIKFLEDNKKKDGIKVTSSGLQYKVITEGTGPKPDSTSVVKVNYRGTLADGTEFDSSYKRGEPATFPLDQVIKGWAEGIRLMPVGSKYMLYIPSDLAYGERGAGEKVKGNSALVFEVELLGIETPDSTATPESEPTDHIVK